MTQPPHAPRADCFCLKCCDERFERMHRARVDREDTLRAGQRAARERKIRGSTELRRRFKDALRACDTGSGSIALAAVREIMSAAITGLSLPHVCDLAVEHGLTVVDDTTKSPQVLCNARLGAYLQE